ncbi:MAG: hypothetical protein DI595_12730 [Agrobacterium fabrum]|uniref:DUF1653 domain-containing protein n=1 Tax=Agrobacterium fabrum TaxID=1176649 RepID=A0A2W5GVF3_9HYPH|nr:MAG: hypothetical protein DI595_12730 [Agrobacterium fabrum]
MVTDEMVEKAAEEMARQDITFASCDRGWQKRTIRAALENALSAAEPVAVRHDFDGHGFQYIDSGSGSDWKTRHPDAQMLYDRPQQPTPSVAVKVPTMPQIEDRRPLDDDDPDGYLESNSDWAVNNNDAVEWLADNHAAIRSAISAQVQDVAQERYRHKKRGSTYTVMARGRLQVDGDLDNEKVVVYLGEDGQTWVRPEYEFNDGRFEPLPPAPAKQEG